MPLLSVANPVRPIFRRLYARDAMDRIAKKGGLGRRQEPYRDAAREVDRPARYRRRTGLRLAGGEIIYTENSQRTSKPFVESIALSLPNHSGSLDASLVEQRLIPPQHETESCTLPAWQRRFGLPVTAVRRGEFGANAYEGRQSRSSEQLRPVPIRLVLEAGRPTSRSYQRRSESAC